MPWSTDADVERHKKGLTAKQKSTWRKIANAHLSKTGDEASAIRIANSAVGSSESSVLKSGYLLLATKLQESCADLTVELLEARVKACLELFGIHAEAKHFVPLMTYPNGLSEAGARHSAGDLQLLQTIHDHAVNLGAACGAEEMSESSALVRDRETVKLTESASTLETIVLREAKADYEIKLIAPGKGSSAFYPSEVLKRDGPKVFGAGTHVYLNHPTAAEESARPEGDVSNLAGVLTTSAVYHESHSKGEGLYARMKVFADHAQMVEEKAPHVGMSIRASGVAESGKMRDGVPILKELTRAESVDVVTRAGAGGMILTEAARPASQPQEVSMTDAEIKTLVESAVSTAVKAAVAEVQKPVSALEQRALRGDALIEANRVLGSMSLRENVKALVIEYSLRGDLPLKEGALDTEKFAAIVTSEAQKIGSALSDGGRVVGMGTTQPVTPIDPKEAERQEATEKRLREDGIRIFESIGLPKDAAEKAFIGRPA